jgi:hypothetical protein
VSLLTGIDTSVVTRTRVFIKGTSVDGP